MALNFTDLRKGTVFKMNAKPYLVLEYNHKVMGRGGATVSVRVKNLFDSKVQTISFKGSEQIESANLERLNLQYLYSNGQGVHFMDNQTYEQFSLGAKAVEDKGQYLKEGSLLSGLIFEGSLVAIELPKNVDLKVIRADDVVKGDTSTAVTKKAELETGLEVRVPAFIKTGDTVSVDTETGNYRERVKI